LARSLSSQKRLRQSVRRAERNKARKSIVKSRVKKVVDAVIHKDATTASKALLEALVTLDRAAGKRTIHRNTAARRKSRLTRKVNALAASK